MVQHRDAGSARFKRWMNPKTWWTSLGMNTESLLLMMKGALAPTIVVAISQSHAVADVTTTTGYLAALIAVSAQCLLPRAKFVKVMFFCLLSLCVTASISCLAIYTAVKARHPSNNIGDDKYDSNAAAVAAVWLFVMIWIGNALRAWRMAELTDPIVSSSIFALVTLTRASNWTNAQDGFDFCVRVIKTFLIGFGIATGVSLFVLPRTCRGGVFKDINTFATETNAVLRALTEFVNTASRRSFLTRQKTYAGSEDGSSGQETADQTPPESRFAKARSHLLKASNTLNALDAKLQADLKYSKNEVALGKLSGADLEEISTLLRGVLLPLSGMSLLPVIVDSFTEAEARLAAMEGEPLDAVTRDQALINRSIDALSLCLDDTKTLVGVGLQYFLQQLELAESGKKKQSDVEVADKEFMPMGLDPSSEHFVNAFKLKIEELAQAKQRVQANAFLVSSRPPSPHESEDGISEVGDEDEDEDVSIHQDFLLVLYLFNLQTMVLDATLNLITFAKKKVDDDTMKRWRLIAPAPRIPWTQTPREKPTPSPDNERPNEGEVEGIQVVDPVHLKPTNALERGSEWFRPVSRLIGSELSMFGLRVAAASLCVGVIAFLEQTHEFFVHQRGVWAMIVIVIGMSPTSGQSFFGFFGRIMATVIALILSLVAWYIVDGKTPGVIIFLFLANVIEYYTYVKKPHLFGPSVIAVVTLNIIIAYELQVKVLGVERAEANGQPYYPIYIFGPYKLAAVAVGCVVSFFWTLFPYPITAKSKVPRLAGGSLFNLARYYSAMFTAVERWIHKGRDGSPQSTNKEDAQLRTILGNSYKQELLALNALRMNSHFASYEPPIGGKFPSAIYADLTAGMQRILTIMSLMAHIAQTMPAPSFGKQQQGEEDDGADAPAWPRHNLATTWASSEFQFQGTTSLLCHLASSLRHCQPLPPFLAVSETFPLMRHGNGIHTEILQTQNSYQPAFTAFISLELLRTVLSLELQKQLDEIRQLVGEIIFRV